MKYLAYLNCAPGDSKKTRSEVYRAVKKIDPEMPETLGREYLIEYMLSIGPGINTGMGYVELSFPAIESWARLRSIELGGDEAITIRDLSRAYVHQSNISGKSTCPAPWVKGVADIETHNMLKGMSDISKIATNVKPLSKKKR